MSGLLCLLVYHCQASTNSIGGSSDAPTSRKLRIDKVDLDKFDMGVVRGTVQELLLQHKIVPTVKTLKV